MNERNIVRRLLRRITGGVPASASLAKALLDWAEPHHAWLTGNECDGAFDWADLAACTGLEQLCGAAPPHALVLTARLAALLTLEPLDTALLALVVACDRLPRVASLAKIAGAHGHDLPSLLGVLAGADDHEADRAVRRSAVLKLGLAGFRANRLGEIEVDIRWTLERLLDRAPAQDEAMLDTLVGARQAARLATADFAHVDDTDFLVRLLRGRPPPARAASTSSSTVRLGPARRSSRARWPRPLAWPSTGSARRTTTARSRRGGTG
jgi:hypothetical protein